MVRDYNQKKSFGVETPLLEHDEKGFVRVVFNKTGVKDHDGDIIVPEAYTKTLKEQQGNIAHLVDHTWKISNLLAWPSVKMQGDLLIGESTLNLKDPYVAGIHQKYLGGIIKQHSIGFATIKQQEKSDYNEISEVMLYEGSAVVFGANPNTPTLDAKSLSKKTYDELLEEHETFHNDFKKYLKSGMNGEDILIFSRRLDQLTTLLKNTKPSTDTLPGNEDEAEIKSILETFKF